MPLTAYTAPSSEYLDRSPSLSSASSGASSAASHPPVTPALPPTSSFPSLHYARDKDASADSNHHAFSQTYGQDFHPGLPISNSTTNFRPSHSTTRQNSIASLAALAKARDAPPPLKAQAWNAGHRTGAGASSFDSARSRFGATKSQSMNLRTGALDNGEGATTSNSNGFSSHEYSRSPSPPKSIHRVNSSIFSASPANSTSPRPASPAGAVPSSPNRSETIAAWRSSTVATPARTLPPTPSHNRSMSPIRPSSPTRSGSPTPSAMGYSSPNRLPQSPGSTAHTRAVASSIFSSRDPAVPPPPSSPFSFGGGGGLERSVVGSVRGLSASPGSFSRGHRRAMTLPQLGAAGLPVPADAGGNGGGAGLVGEEVAGLPGRVRLSRPADAPSHFAPSAVFSSSHGLNRVANGSTPPVGGLLPSQTVRAIDRQRQDLVAYEYLCHVAEAKEWLASTIDPRAAETLEHQTSIGQFEQSLRNGYALAHLARKLGGPECAGGIFNAEQLQYRHTGNIDIFFTFVRSVELPEIFRFETVDLYEAKNLPKVIYCLHALSHLLARRGMAGRMNNLVGQIEFTDAEVNATQRDLNNAGVRMPNFGGIGKALEKQIKEEPEPESESDRQSRLLLEAGPSVVGLQAHGRGALARRKAAALARKHRAYEAEQHRMAEEASQRAETERLRMVEEERRREEEQRRVEQEERRRIERQRQMEEEERLRLEAEAAAEQARLQAIEAARVRRAEEVRRAGIVLTGFQAHARGYLTRRSLDAQLTRLDDSESTIVGFQASARGMLARRRVLDRINLMRSTEGPMIGVQAQIRGILARKAHAHKAHSLRRAEVVRSVGGLQSLARAALVRRRVDVQRKKLGFVEPDVVSIQAQVRGYLVRTAYCNWRDHLYDSDIEIVELQSLIRGFLARRKFQNIRRHFNHNISKVVQLQAAIRSRRQGSQYRQLRMGTNVPVGTIKNFVRLLDDSEFDYREELEVESVRKELVTAIRDTQELQDEVDELDTKIALLVKSKITHEVTRAHRAATGALGGSMRNPLAGEGSDPFAGEVLDRQTQRKLELYQHLFGLLQTSPRYLARLLADVGRSGASEKAQKTVEMTTSIIFGHAQNGREEFYFLKLMQQSVQEEVDSVMNLGTFARSSYPFVRVLVEYARNVNRRDFLRDFLGPPIKAILDATNLDLSSDPVAIYRADIAAEEMHTGRVSARPVDVGYAQALLDEKTKAIFIDHLKALRRASDSLLSAIFATTNRMPFGFRYIAREVFRALRARFPEEPEDEVLRIVSHLLYYRFIQPAALTPEKFDIVDPSFNMTAHARRNLGDACKMLNQIAAGRHFSDDMPYMKPMEAYISQNAARFLDWTREVINVADAEEHFHIDAYQDAASSRRPVVYISPNNIYGIHSMLTSKLDVLAPEREDPLRLIIEELNGVGSTGGASSSRMDEIALTVTTRITEQEDPEAGNKARFNDVKRKVLAILKVHHGNDLEAVLTQRVTAEDEDTWLRMIQDEEEEERRQLQRRGPGFRQVPTTDNLRNLSFHQLKQETLLGIIELRKCGMVDRADKYQAILNAIALDIRGKHHRRIQRQNELTTMRATLQSLNKKKQYLRDQTIQYNAYIQDSMASIQRKGKKRLVLPWSMQAQHERSLEKAGKVYSYGSYKYTALELYNRGILLSIDQYSPKQFQSISLTLSSDEVGVFEITAAYMGVPVATVDLKLQDLLEMQFVGKYTVEIGGIAKANLNLLIAQLNKKFYK